MSKSTDTDDPMNRSTKLRIQIEEIVRKSNGINMLDGIEGRNGSRYPIVSSTYFQRIFYFINRIYMLQTENN